MAAVCPSGTFPGRHRQALSIKRGENPASMSGLSGGDVMGCFGAPMTAANKVRYCDNNNYNRNPARQNLIMKASPNTFGFDCVCLIKDILWGWNGDRSKTYGGAVYASNGVPDVGADTMMNTYCKDVSAGGRDKMVPGEAVWMSGHIGIYIRGGLAVECSPRWKNSVQITAVKNTSDQVGYPSRIWKKHGKLPWIKYEAAPLRIFEEL